MTDVQIAQSCLDPSITGPRQEELVHSSKPFLQKNGRSKFILRCNYDAKYFNQLPVFYKNILDSFNELKTLCGYDQSPDIVLFNNKDILVGGKPLYIYQ